MAPIQPNKVSIYLSAFQLEFKLSMDAKAYIKNCQTFIMKRLMTNVINYIEKNFSQISQILNSPLG